MPYKYDPYQPDWVNHIRAEATQTMSIFEACTRVGVSIKTMRRWVAEKKVGYTRRMNGAIRIHPESLNWKLVPKNEEDT